MATGYGNQSYWEERYKGQANTYEWYMPWETLKADCLPHFHSVHAQPAAAASEHQHLTLAEQRKAIAQSDAAAAKSAKAAADGAASSSAASASASSSSSSSSASAAASAGSSSSAEVAPIPPAAAAAAPAPLCPLCLSSRLLIVGCGNSELSAHLWADSFTSQLSVDYSEVVIAKMRDLYASIPALASSFVFGDCRDLRPLGGECREGGCFDVVLDKGTLDAILCGAEANKNAAAMIAEMHRLLAPGGVLLVITYGQPTARLPHLERKQYQWTVSQQSLGPTRYLYVCKKKQAKR